MKKNFPQKIIGYFIGKTVKDEQLTPKKFSKLKKAPKNNGNLIILILCSSIDDSKSVQPMEVGHGPCAVVKKQRLTLE